MSKETEESAGLGSSRLREAAKKHAMKGRAIRYGCRKNAEQVIFRHEPDLGLAALEHTVKFETSAGCAAE